MSEIVARTNLVIMTKRLDAAQAADQLGAGGDVAPLVGTADLEAAAVMVVQPEKIVALQNLVAELGEAHAVLGREALLDAVLGEHLRHAEMFADLAQKGDERKFFQPIVVVDDDGRCGRVVEIQETGKILANSHEVLRDLLLAEQLPLG